MKKGRLLTVLGLLCVTAALRLTAYNIIDDIRAGENAAMTLEKLMPMIGSTKEVPSEAETGAADPSAPSDAPEETDPEEPAAVYPEYILHPEMPMPVKIVDGNVFSYSVVEVETLYPTEVERMTTGDWDLTLFTCTTGGKTRVTVRCARTGAAVLQ